MHRDWSSTPTARSSGPQTYTASDRPSGSVRQTRATATSESSLLRGRPPPSPQSGLYSRPRSGSASSHSSATPVKAHQQQRLRSPKGVHQQRSASNSPGGTLVSPATTPSRPHSTESANSQASSIQSPAPSKVKVQEHTKRGARHRASPSSPLSSGVVCISTGLTRASSKAFVGPPQRGTRLSPCGSGAARSRTPRNRCVPSVHSAVQCRAAQEGLPAPLVGATEELIDVERLSLSSSRSASPGACLAVAVGTLSQHAFDCRDSDEEEGHFSAHQRGACRLPSPPPRPRTIFSRHPACDSDSECCESSEDDFVPLEEQEAAPRLCSLGGDFGELAALSPIASRPTVPLRSGEAVGSRPTVSLPLDIPCEMEDTTLPCYAEKYRRTVQSYAKLNASHTFPVKR